MTIDRIVPYETTSLVKLSKPKLYPQAKINVLHNQLKHRISTKDGSTIYYCTNYEIYALHTSTRNCSLVKSLSWEPRCLDAAHGWICAATDRGKCVFIQIHHAPDGQPRSRASQHRAEVDDLLPLDLDPVSRSLAPQDIQHSRSADRGLPKYKVYNHSLGTELVNAVTIHKVQDIEKSTEDEIVVLLANNDKTVRIFSLSQMRPLVVLTYPTLMNHATLSPDGDLLVAVGDMGRAFFHRRVPFENPTIIGDKAFSTYGWIAVAEPSIPQMAVDDACFCTGFSSSGQRCAVASERGIVAIYDTSLIADGMEHDDAVVCVLTTSRPTEPGHMGAARSMSFSPAPWDLLVVAEDQGRVTVLDTRSPAFMFRQVLELSTDLSNVVSMNIPEVQDTLQQRQSDIEQRFLQSHREAMETQNYLAAMTNTASHLDYTAERRQSETEMLNSEVQALAESANRLTESQRRVIESIGLRYAQANNASPSNSTIRPINVDSTAISSSRDGATSVSSAQSPLATTLAANRLSLRENTEGISSNTDNSLSSSHSAYSPVGREQQLHRTASIAEYVHQRNRERERERQRTIDRQPRRRSSIVISNSSSRNSQNNPPTLAPIGTLTPTYSTSPSRLPSSINDDRSTATLANSNDTTPPSRTASSLAIPGYWPPPEEWANAPTDPNGSGDIVARIRREADLATIGAAPSDLRPRNSTSTTLPDPRIYHQTMHSLLARTEIARNELQRNENEMAARQMAGIDYARAGMERMEQAANRIRERSQTTHAAAESVRGQMEQSRVGGLVVQGVGWSTDGRSLFVATEMGLLEYEVNIRERMQWPGVAFL